MEVSNTLESTLFKVSKLSVGEKLLSVDDLLTGISSCPSSRSPVDTSLKKVSFISVMESSVKFSKSKKTVSTSEEAFIISVVGENEGASEKITKSEDEFWFDTILDKLATTTVEESVGDMFSISLVFLFKSVPEALKEEEEKFFDVEKNVGDNEIDAFIDGCNDIEGKSEGATEEMTVGVLDGNPEEITVGVLDGNPEGREEGT